MSEKEGLSINVVLPMEIDMVYFPLLFSLINSLPGFTIHLI